MNEIEILNYAQMNFIQNGLYMVAFTAFVFITFRLMRFQKEQNANIFGIVSLIALFGTFFKLFYTGRYEKLSLLLYLFMGWLVIIDIKTLFEVIEFNGFLLLILGGVSYSIGTIFYSLDKKYAHTVWHLFVLAGSTLHFFFILFYII